MPPSSSRPTCGATTRCSVYNPGWDIRRLWIDSFSGDSAQVRDHRLRQEQRGRRRVPAAAERVGGVRSVTLQSTSVAADATTGSASGHVRAHLRGEVLDGAEATNGILRAAARRGQGRPAGAAARRARRPATTSASTWALEEETESAHAASTPRSSSSCARRTTARSEYLKLREEVVGARGARQAEPAHPAGRAPRSRRSSTT